MCARRPAHGTRAGHGAVGRARAYASGQLNKLERSAGTAQRRDARRGRGAAGLCSNRSHKASASTPAAHLGGGALKCAGP